MALESVLQALQAADSPPMALWKPEWLRPCLLEDGHRLHGVFVGVETDAIVEIRLVKTPALNNRDYTECQ
jgi:hypothetical protein